MVRVRVSNNLTTTTTIVDENTTVKAVLEETGINYSRRLPMIDGEIHNAADLDKTFAELGISESCFITAIEKVDNA